MTILELCHEIEHRRTEALSRRISAYPRQNPIASDLGPCTREYVLAMTKWQERPLPNPALKARFERGNLIENAVIQELLALGLEVRKERTPFEVKDKQGRVVLRGMVDGFITVDRKDYPLEVKSLDPNVFRQIQTVEDFGKYVWAAKYPRQLQAYLYAHNLEAGFFLLDNCKGEWTLLPVSLDYECMERILKQCEEAVEHRDAGTLPDYHKDPAVCNRCWAKGRVCDPPTAYQGLLLADDPDFEAMLDRRGELAAVSKEYDSLNKAVQEKVKGKDGLVCGNWLIQGSEQVRTYRPQPEKIIRLWQSRITRVQDDSSDKETL